MKYGDHLELVGNCSDPDLPYGDILTFTWYSSINKKLGVGKNLSNVKLEPGEHTITLEVSDKANQKLSTSINVTIEKTTAVEVNKPVQSNILGVIILIIIIIIHTLSVKPTGRIIFLNSFQ